MRSPGRFFVTSARGRFCKEYEQHYCRPNLPDKVMITPEEIAAIKKLMDELETQDSPLLQTNSSTGLPGAVSPEGQPGQPSSAQLSQVGMRPPLARRIASSQL